MQIKLLRVLLYFDVFSYPLSRDELFAFIGIEQEKQREAIDILDALVRGGHIRHYGGFYYVNGTESLVERRLAGNRRARQRMRDALRYSRIIASFPYVRGVFLSGSISKEFMAERDDIDYFIVTEPGRLWISRSLLTLFKKIFLFNSYRNFCINYFVDTQHLRIKEQNQFVATEIATTIPTYNLALHREFLDTNAWTLDFYPAFRRNGEFIVAAPSMIKGWLERLLGIMPADILDDFFLKSSRKYIRRKFRHMDHETFHHAFSILKHELRFLPERQQSRILIKYHDNLQSFERLTGLRLMSSEDVTKAV